MPRNAERRTVRSRDLRLDGSLELVAQHRLERRPALRALPRAPLRAVNTGGTDRDRVVRQRALYTVAVLAVSDPADEHGVDLEPETEWEHDAKVAPPLGREQRDAGVLLRR